jgi:hypothetical protein
MDFIKLADRHITFDEHPFPNRLMKLGCLAMGSEASGFKRFMG